MTGYNDHDSMPDAPRTDAEPDDGAPTPPAFLEDPLLAVAVGEAEEFVGSAGWEQRPQLFALVPTADLIAAQPEMAGQLDVGSYYTPIAQEDLPDIDLSDALAQLSWPPAVEGCVLVQEIVVLPPTAQEELSDDPEVAAEQAAVHPERTEARLAVGVLRGGSGACVMRLRGEHEDTPLRGADLAPNLISALELTFQ